ncbi:hypothetical protein HDU85_000019 [Gaertneriomyces sp. JEL0708]|nr:hypothetical protein HDU85_000019 [Gaertneriomyces sp. JEL0708]
MLRGSPIVLLLASLCVISLRLPAACAQGSWGRRVYYTTTDCSAGIGYQTHVFSPHAPCPGGRPVPINEVCEVKAKEGAVLSSEGTGCDPVASNADVSDTPYFPPSAQGEKIPGANYLTINQYLNQPQCSTANGETTITQTTYAADGLCHVMEPGMYFKAFCNSAAGVVQWCDDDKCTVCRDEKVVRAHADCEGPLVEWQPAKSICVMAPGAVDQPLPVINGTILPTGTVTSPVPTASSTPPADSDGKNGQKDSEKNSAATGAVLQQGLTGIAAVALAAFF